MRGFVLTMLACLAASLPAGAEVRDEARPRDLQRLQQDLANLDEALQGLEVRVGDSQAVGLGEKEPVAAPGNASPDRAVARRSST